MAAVAVASVVGMGTALLYSKSREQAAIEASQKQIRQERRKYRERYRQTAEYQRRKQLHEERKRQREATMQEVAFFNENDEMVITKVDAGQTEELPAGYVKVNRGEPIGHYKVSKDMTGEAFITNLETINKKRVEQQRQQHT